MMFLILVFYYVSISSICSASDDRNTETLKIASQRLSKIISEDCKPLEKRGVLTYAHLSTSLHVEKRLRKLNDGRLPLSLHAKEKIAQYLHGELECEQKAVSFFTQYAQNNSLHELSVTKIFGILAGRYNAIDSPIRICRHSTERIDIFQREHLIKVFGGIEV